MLLQQKHLGSVTKLQTELMNNLWLVGWKDSFLKSDEIMGFKDLDENVNSL